MPQRRRKKPKSYNLAPIVATLNLFIALVVLSLIYAIYSFVKQENIYSSDNDTSHTELAETKPTPLEISKRNAETTAIPTVMDSTESKTVASGSEKDNFEESNDFFSNDLFIGDSIMTGFYLYGYLNKDNVFAKVGMTPGTVLNESVDGVTFNEKLNSLKPRNVYIMLGTNGLSYLTNDHMAEETVKLLEHLSSNYPDSKVYLLSIPPVTKVREQNHPQKMSDVNDYGDKLSELANEAEVKFLDIRALLKDKDGYMDEMFAEEDGLHFKPAAYTAVLDYIKNNL
ncbi:MAG: GDSL-type esterase/lipase family protein [Eubacterium sp.]|nr:GDSL-type esterase/lipase family protein [Eubacterium sp.]